MTVDGFELTLVGVEHSKDKTYTRINMLVKDLVEGYTATLKFWDDTVYESDSTFPPGSRRFYRAVKVAENNRYALASSAT